MKTKLTSILLVSVLISLSCVNAIANNKKTLLIFSADWCTVCHKAKNDIDNDPVLSEVIKNYDIVVADYDVDKDLVKGYNIKTVPSFVLIDGNKVSKKTGYYGPKDLNNFLK